jgi:hypothetical protein
VLWLNSLRQLYCFVCLCLKYRSLPLDFGLPTVQGRCDIITVRCWLAICATAASDVGGPWGVGSPVGRRLGAGGSCRVEEAGSRSTSLCDTTP